MDFRHVKYKVLTSRFKNESLFNAFALLTVQIKKEAENYDVILSDEGSGRLVSLIFKDLIDKKRIEMGKKDAKIYFLALRDGSHFHKGEGKEYTNRLEEFVLEKVKSAKRVLISTEHISTGAHFPTLLRILDKNRIKYDVATISCNERITEEQKIKNLKFGNIGDIGLRFYQGEEYSGTEKRLLSEIEYKEDDLGESNKLQLTEHQKEMRWLYPKRVNEEELGRKLNISLARKDAKIYAEELSKLLE